MNNTLQTALNNVRRDYWLLAAALRAVNEAPTGPAEEETNRALQATVQYKKALRHLHELEGQYPETQRDEVGLELCELEPLPLTGLVAVAGQRYAALQPVNETGCNTNATQELPA